MTHIVRIVCCRNLRAPIWVDALVLASATVESCQFLVLFVSPANVDFQAPKLSVLVVPSHCHSAAVTLTGQSLVTCCLCLFLCPFHRGPWPGVCLLLFLVRLSCPRCAPSHLNLDLHTRILDAVLHNLSRHGLTSNPLGTPPTILPTMVSIGLH